MESKLTEQLVQVYVNNKIGTFSKFDASLLFVPQKHENVSKFHT